MAEVKISEIGKEKKSIPISKLAGFTGYGAELQEDPKKAGMKAVRIGQVAAKSFYEDLPYLRQMHGIPKSFVDVKPESGEEQIVSVGTKLIRDIALWQAGGQAVGLASKLRPISSIGSTVQHWNKFGPMVNKIVPEFAKGFILGGVTSGEEGKDAMKKALTFGTFTGAIPPAISGLSLAGRGIWKVAPNSIKKPAQTVAEWIGLHTKENVASMANMKRYGDVAMQQLDDEAFRLQLKENLTPLEDAILPFYMEKEAGGLTSSMKRIIKESGLTKNLDKVSNQVANHLDKKWVSIVESTGGDVNYLKNYIPHIWDIPKNKEKSFYKWFTTLNPQTKKRSIPTIIEGIKKGFIPKYRNASDLIKAYDDIATTVNANNVFANTLKELEISGHKIVQSFKKAPNEWKALDHPALSRALGFRPGTQVKVHPDVFESLESVFGKKIDSKVFSAIHTTNSLAKAGNFLGSLFHHTTLTESAISAGLEKEALKVWNPANIIKSLKQGNSAVFENIPRAKDAVKHGLMVRATSDVQRGLVESTLYKAEQQLASMGKLSGAGSKLIKGIRKPIEFNNKLLWDYYNPTFKLTAYEQLTANMLKKFPKMEVGTVKKEVAQFVNDTFGGQVWELLGKSPQWQQMAHMILLSPDWTLSTARQAFSIFGTGAQSATGQALRRELGQDFWRRSILYFIGGANLLNYAITKSVDGEGRFMFQNKGKNNDRLFIGRDKEGREVYARHGKQFREMFEWLSNPYRTLGNKISPFWRTVSSQLTGYTPSGWRTSIAEARTGKDRAIARVREAVNTFLPFSRTRLADPKLKGLQKTLGVALPLSRGESEYAVKKMMRKAYLNENQELAQEAYEIAERNNYDADKLRKNAEKYAKKKLNK